MYWKGFLGTRSIHTSLARLGCVYNASLVHVVLLTMKIPWSAKCKCPLKLMVCSSNKLNITKGTRAPSK